MKKGRKIMQLNREDEIFIVAVMKKETRGYNVDTIINASVGDSLVLKEVISQHITNRTFSNKTKPTQE